MVLFFLVLKKRLSHYYCRIYKQKHLSLKRLSLVLSATNTQCIPNLPDQGYRSASTSALLCSLSWIYSQVSLPVVYLAYIYRCYTFLTRFLASSYLTVHCNQQLLWTFSEWHLSFVPQGLSLVGLCSHRVLRILWWYWTILTLFSKALR